jgi:hypothetical protein
VTLLVAEPALLGVGWADTSRVTLNTARVARASEGALNTLVSTISLVVTNLTAVVALASHTATRRSVGAFASEVASLVAAAERSVR